MTVRVLPEDLPVISGQLGAVLATLTSAVATMPGGKPVPAGADAASAMVATAMAVYHEDFSEVTGLGMSYLASGSQTLVPVGIDYRAADIAGGGDVSARGLTLI
ncbi:PE domain-containing protein [Nocardia sp. NPDC003693]